MAVIDAHHHVWWVAKRTHPFPAIFGNRLARDFTPDDRVPELRAAGIDGTILVQSLNDYDETIQYLDLADTHDFIRGVVGWIPLTDPAACERALDGVRARPRFVGVRHLMNYEPDPNWLLRADVIESLRQLAQRRVAFEAIPSTTSSSSPCLSLRRGCPT